ncbi:MAG: hypothetical protein IJ893_02660 [Bacteroidales bacterium]|nr:hypothetical protein [Bacteroidales bacterium]
MSDTVIVALVAGLAAVIGGVITQLGEGIRQKRKRKFDKDDGKDKDIEALKAGLKWVLYDRIRYLGQKYINDGLVDFDDRRILNEMHKSYHDGLGGNGDLDNLMQQVNALPLK